MKKKPPDKKLGVKRETLRRLDLDKAAGGRLINSGRYCQVPSDIQMGD